jgi:integrase
VFKALLQFNVFTKKFYRPLRDFMGYNRPMQARIIPKHRKQRNTPIKATQENLPNGGKRWRVELREGGQRQRRYYSTEQAALEFIAGEAERRRNLGRSAAGVSPRVLEDALRALEILAPFPAATLVESARFYVDAQARRRGSKTVRKVAEEFIANRRANGNSKQHLADLRDRLLGGGKRSNPASLCGLFGDTLICEVSTADAERWLAKLQKNYSPQSVHNYRRAARTLFNFAVPRDYCGRNVIDAIQPPRIKPKSGTGIFSPAEVEAVLRAADADLLPWLAIAFFTGLRSAELDRLHWDDVNFSRGHVEVPAAKAKTAQRRLVPILPALAAWLAPYHDKKGAIRPKNFHQKRRNAYRAAGFGKPGSETRAERAAGITLRAAPDNVARHSFASYRLADTSDAAKTALELGHTSTALLFNTYRDLVTPEAAAAFFAVRPEADAGNVIRFAGVA